MDRPLTPARDDQNQTRRPVRKPISTTMSAMTSRTWMKAPAIFSDKPSIQSTNNMTAMVHNIRCTLPPHGRPPGIVQATYHATAAD